MKSHFGNLMLFFLNSVSLIQEIQPVDQEIQPVDTSPTHAIPSAADSGIHPLISHTGQLSPRFLITNNSNDQIQFFGK